MFHFFKYGTTLMKLYRYQIVTVLVCGLFPSHIHKERNLLFCGIVPCVLKSLNSKQNIQKGPICCHSLGKYLALMLLNFLRSKY